MRGVYTAKIAITGVTSAKTLLHLAAPSDNCVEIISASVTNYSNETNEQIRCSIQPITTNGSPTGTSVTPGKHEQDDQASAVTVLGNLTAEPTTYSADSFGEEGAASIGGWSYKPLPEERPVMKGASFWGLRLLDAITSLNAVASITFREIG